MKKNQLLASSLLALAGIFAGTASAQTNVLIYGLVDLGVVRESGGAAGSVTKLSSGVTTGSRLGFKGTEDLGGGLNALFLLESGFDMSTGASTQGGLLFGRQIYMGLGSATAGTLTLGRQYSAVNNSLCAVDVFVCGLAGAAMSLFSVGGKGTATGGTGQGRINNSIKYSAPTFGGLTGDFLYAVGEQAGATKANGQIDASLSYKAGPVFVTLAHNRVTDATNATTGKVTFLGGRYDFGVASLALGTAVNKGSYSGLANILMADSRDYLVGVSVPFGASTFLISYDRKDDRTAANNDVNLLAVGYLYQLSKRTSMYFSHARMKNSVADTVGSAGGFYTVGNALDPGTGDKAFNFGMRHTF